MRTAQSSGTLEFALKGTSLGLFLDGVQMLAVSDTTWTAGTAGMRLAGPAGRAVITSFAADDTPRDVALPMLQDIQTTTKENATVIGVRPGFPYATVSNKNPIEKRGPITILLLDQP
jgi:hypothetical protein